MNLYTFHFGNKKLKINKKSEPRITLKEHQLFSRLLTVGAVYQLDLHGSSPPNFRGGDLKMSDQNNWGGRGGPEEKIKFGGKLNLRGGL